MPQGRFTSADLEPSASTARGQFSLDDLAPAASAKPAPVPAYGVTNPESVKVTNPPPPPERPFVVGDVGAQAAAAGAALVHLPPPPAAKDVPVPIFDQTVAGPPQIVRGARELAPSFATGPLGEPGASAAAAGEALAGIEKPVLPTVPTAQVLTGASDVMEGAFATMTPAAVAGFVINPLIFSVLVGAGMGAQTGIEKGAETLGATPEQARFAGNLAAILAGAGAAKGVHAVRGARAAGAEARAARAAATQARQAAADVLGVASDADAATIQSAYRAAARANHPDVGGDPTRMADINLAYQYLQDHPASARTRGGMAAWVRSQVDWLKSQLQPEAPASEPATTQPRALPAGETVPPTNTPANLSAEAPVPEPPATPSAPVEIPVSSSTVAAPASASSEAPLALAQAEPRPASRATGAFRPEDLAQADRNALARAEQETDLPLTKDLSAMEAGRRLERRVREGVSPTGEERRVPAEPIDVSPPKAEREEHSYSSTQVNLPEDLSKAVVKMAAKIPDKDLAPNGRAGESEATAPHITVKYGIESTDVDKVREVLAGEPPVTVTLGKTSLFQNDEADVLKVDVDSPDLHRLNAKIADALKTTDTHPDYIPHATIAYLKPGKGKAYAGDDRLQGQQVTIDRITFSTKDGRIFEIPLTGQPKAPRALNVADFEVPDEVAAAKSRYITDGTEEAKREYLDALANHPNTIEQLRTTLRSRLGDRFRVYRAGNQEPTGVQSWSIDRQVAASIQRVAKREKIFEAEIGPEDVIAPGLSSDYELLVRAPQPANPSPKTFTRPKSAVLDKAYSVGGNRFQRVIVTEQDGSKHTYDVKVREGRHGALLSNKEAKAEALRQHRLKLGVSSEAGYAAGQTPAAAPPRPESPGHPDERAPVAGRGVVAGRGEESRAARRRRQAAERAAEDQQHEVTTLDEIVSRATADGYRGDPETLRAELDSRLQFIKDIDEQLKQAGDDPDVLLRAIAKYGGISLQKETGWKGEIRWLQESQRNFGTATKPKYAWGQVRETKGVFSNSGLSLDRMLEALRQDDQFAYIETLNDLVEAIRDAATAKDDNRLAIDKLAKSLQPEWWARFQPSEDAEVGTGDEDISFNPEEFETPPPADVNEFGEAQARLPGAESARQVGQAATTFRAPVQASGEDFNLTSGQPEVEEAPPSLFGEEKPASATPTKPTARKPSGGGGGSEAMAGLFSTTLPVTPGHLQQVVAVQFPEMVELARTLLGTPSVVKRFRMEGKRGEFQHNESGWGRIRLHADLFRRSGPLSVDTMVGARVYDERQKQWTVIVAQSPTGPILRPEAGGNEYPALASKEGIFDGYRVDISKEMLQQLAATLAHEIGHLVDWLPDKTLKRGNLLGRLFTLQGFLKHTFIASDGETIENQTIREELQALSDKWRPWDPETASASFKAYRHSGKELFADAISVLLNNPGLLEHDAPTFYEQFFNELDNKPDVKQAYFTLQAVLASTPEELVARRRDHVNRMFREADAKALDIERQRQAEQRWSLKSLWYRLRIEHVDKNTPVADRLRALEKSGTPINPDDDPRYLLEERTWLGAKLHGFTARHFQPIHEQLTTGGVGWARFREALIYERILAGDRSEVANPLGLTPDTVEPMYAALKAELDPEQQRELRDALTAFRAAVWQVVDEAHAVGLYSDDQYASMKNNPAYATYRVVEYLEKNVTSRVYHQIGTLKDVADVGVGTILKTLVTLRAIEHQRVKLASFAQLAQAEPGSVQQAKEVWTGKGLKPIDPPDPKTQKLVTYYDNGRLRGKWVDPYIADSLNNESVALNSVVLESLKVMNGRAFRPLFVTFNTGFQTWNIQRDFWRFYKNMSEMTVPRALKRYWQAVPLARVRAFGAGESPSAARRQALADLNEAEEARILSVTLGDLVSGRQVEDTEIEDVLSRMGINAKPAEAQHALLKPFVPILDWIKKAGDFIETLPKAAAIYELKGQGSISQLTAAQRSHIRRRIGTPDILAGGTLKPVQNEILLFSNVYIQGIRSDYEMATQPGTRQGWWWKTAKLNIAPALVKYAAIFGIGALLKGAAGGDDGDDDTKAWRERLRQIYTAFSGITEYDLTNYLTIPLGLDTDGSTIYVRLPMDDTGRVIHGLTWKALRTLGGDHPDVFASAMQILDYTIGQLPGVTPTLGGISDAAQFAAGGRVYDPFRNRFLFSEDEAKARDWRTVKKFVGYEFQQLGGSILWKFYPGESRPEQRTKLQQILELPIASNIVGRSLRSTGYGRTERLRETQAQVERGEARRRLTEREALNETIRAYQALPAGEQTPRRRGDMALDLAKRLYPDDPALQKKRLDSLRTRLRIGIQRGSADPVVDALLSATSNDQKVAILTQARQTMTPAAFDAWLTTAVREGAISQVLYGQIRRDNATAGAGAR